MSKAEAAVHIFNQGFNCSQALLSTYGEQLGLNKETALKIACPFGAGMGRMSETCGAVTGAYMLIGLKHGKYLAEDDESKEKSYALVNEFNEKFNSLHGSILCKDLLKYDMKKPEDMAAIKEQGLWQKLCPIFIRDAAQVIEELLDL